LHTGFAFFLAESFGFSLLFCTSIKATLREQNDSLNQHLTQSGVFHLLQEALRRVGSRRHENQRRSLAGLDSGF